ncbi:hypothetical protein V2J09_017780 [Rumex salicifolius]
MSSAYHSETDGQTEVLNSCLETYLCCYASEQPKQWARWVSWAEFWYNTNFEGAAGKTPFEGVYGQLAPLLKSYLPGEFIVSAVAEEFWNRDKVLRQLKLPARSNACHQVLVKWDKKPKEEATWMDCLKFKNQFPNSNLDDSSQWQWSSNYHL